MALSVTYLGISLRDFWNLSVKEFTAIEKRFERKHRDELTRWRIQSYYIAYPLLGKNPPTLEKFYPLPWDREFKKDVVYFDFQERIEIFKKFGREDWIPSYWHDQLRGSGD